MSLPRTSTAIIAVAAIVIVGLLVWFMVIAQDLECAECDSDSDCGAGLRCHPFDDGQRRCVDTALTCTEGHVEMPGWAHATLIGALLVGGLAISARRARRQIAGD